MIPGVIPGVIPALGASVAHLRTRMILTYTLLIVLGFGGLAWLAGGQISLAAEEDFAAAQQAQAELLARSLAEDVEHYLKGDVPIQRIQEQLHAFVAQLQSSILLLDANGRVLFAIEQGDGQAQVGEVWQMPEITAALAGNASHAIRADADGMMRVYAAAPLRDEEQVIGVVQTERSLSAALPTVQQRWYALGAGVTLLTLLSVIASSLLATSLTRPLEAMRRAALGMAAGDLNQRLPTNRRDEIGQVAVAFNTMAEQVQAMIEEQRAFAANASHELRTPLTTIRLRSEALREEAIGSALARQYIAEIDDEVTRLSGLVEDLILLARLDAGRMVRGNDEIEVARVVRGLLREAEQLPEAAGIEVKLIAPADLPPLTASLNHMRVLLRNLLNNALAYTPPGGSIICSVRVEDSTLAITVSDTGEGIAAEDLPHITERFFRADKAHTRAVKGSGLGLTLVQSIVHCYGGRLEISSPGLGLGTTACVWLPLPAEP